MDIKTKKKGMKCLVFENCAQDHAPALLLDYNFNSIKIIWFGDAVSHLPK